ncbi:MAG: ParB/RepB/Spo0J family partition protein [Planctomycetaceae bacterium]
MSTRSHQVARIPVDRIQRSGQVREIFDEASIQQLAENIAQHGLIHPIHVHQVGETFRLIAGERRYRAVQLLGHKTILATVASGTIAEGDIVEKMLSENVSREDLNPIELAKGIKQLKELSGQTASAAATRLGLSNKMVSELLSLLSLPDSIQLDVQSGEIPSPRCRTCSVSDPEEQASLAQQVIAGTMTRDRLVAQPQTQCGDKTTFRKPQQCSGHGPLGSRANGGAAPAAHSRSIHRSSRRPVTTGQAGAVAAASNCRRSRFCGTRPRLNHTHSSELKMFGIGKRRRRCSISLCWLGRNKTG